MARIWENKTHSFKKAEEFDDRFWRKAGVQARWEATWMMVMQLDKMRGGRGVEPRLRRSIQHIKRAPR